MHHCPFLSCVACRTARARKRELKKLQQSQAKRTKLGRREVVMMDSLVRVRPLCRSWCILA